MTSSNHTSNLIECVCLNCQSAFSVLPSVIRKGGGKYCSNHCRNLARTTRVECKCLQCGKTFFAKFAHVKIGKAKYCSRQCKGKALTKRVTCECLQCKKVFYEDPSGIKLGRGKFCSLKCLGEYHRGANNPMWRGGNKIKYRGPNWSTQRKAAYERDKGICQCCGKKPLKNKNKYQVHHIKPFREFKGDYIAANQLTNLITLCPSCHKLAEHGKVIIQPYLF